MGLEIKGPPAVKPISPQQSNALEQEQQQQHPRNPRKAFSERIGNWNWSVAGCAAASVWIDKKKTLSIRYRWKWPAHNLKVWWRDSFSRPTGPSSRLKPWGLHDFYEPLFMCWFFPFSVCNVVIWSLFFLRFLSFSHFWMRSETLEGFQRPYPRSAGVYRPNMRYRSLRTFFLPFCLSLPGVLYLLTTIRTWLCDQKLDREGITISISQILVL